MCWYSQRAFSLIETVAAMALLSLGLWLLTSMWISGPNPAISAIEVFDPSTLPDQAEVWREQHRGGAIIYFRDSADSGGDSLPGVWIGPFWLEE